jgi:LPXTG-motif cell wall-anchored protein
VTVVVCEDTQPENCTTDDDTTTVRGVEVLPAVITPSAPVQTLPRTGATTNGLLMAGIGLLLLGSLLLGVGGRMSEAALNLRLPATTALVRYPSPPVINRNLAQGEAIRTSGAWSATSAWRWRKYGGR